MRGHGVTLVLLMLALAFAGCRSSGYLPAGGLPEDRYLVGGGFTIDWQAPADGTAYLVETTTGKIIETRSMAAGDTFRCNWVDGRSDARELEETWGVPPGSARLMLYFKPLSPKARGL